MPKNVRSLNGDGGGARKLKAIKPNSVPGVMLVVMKLAVPPITGRGFMLRIGGTEPSPLANGIARSRSMLPESAVLLPRPNPTTKFVSVCATGPQCQSIWPVA